MEEIRSQQDGGVEVKRRKSIFKWMIAGLVVVLLTGCANQKQNETVEISPEMTGFDDFYQGMWEGEPYTIVYGSQGTEQDTIRLKNFAERIQISLEKSTAVSIPVKSDEELSEEDINDSHLILIGNPETNLEFVEVNDLLPIQVIDGNLEVPDAGWTIGEETAMFTYLLPNPLNRSTYLWVFGASHADAFERLGTMTMNNRQDEYMIKVDERTRYSGKFSKSSSAWTIPTLEAKVTIGDFESVKSEHFIVRYDPIDRQTHEQIEAIIKQRELCYQEYEDRLGVVPQGFIEVDIYMTEGIMEHFVGRDDDTLSGVIYEIHEGGEEDPAYKEKLAKVFVGSLGVPLDEMIRVGFVEELASSRIYLRSSVHPEAAMREILATDAYLPLGYMTGARINQDLDESIVKEELRSFFHYLIGAYGMENMKALVQANESMGAEEAMQSVYEKDLLTLEAEWIEAIAE